MIEGTGVCFFSIATVAIPSYTGVTSDAAIQERSGVITSAATMRKRFRETRLQNWRLLASADAAAGAGAGGMEMAMG